MLFLKILALICSTTLIWKLAYSPFDVVFRISAILMIVVAMRMFVLQ
jgi:hypothetical protein